MKEILKGQCKIDFEKWYWNKYNNHGDEFNYWHLSFQIRHFSEFTGVKIFTQNQLIEKIEEYNSNFL